MKTFYVVRADKFWYKFEDKKQALKHYNYLLDNINGKYKQIDKVYLAEYTEQDGKILEIWNRNREEETSYGKDLYD